MVEFIVTLDVERDIFTRRDLQAEGKGKEVLATILKPFVTSEHLARITRFSKFVWSSARRKIFIALSLKTGEGEGEEVGK